MGRATTAAAFSLAATLFAASLSRAEPPTSAQPSLEEIAVMLSSSNASEVRAAIEGAAGLGSPDVIPMIGERVRAGLPPDLLDAAVDSLTLLADPAVAEVFVELAAHRRPTVRLRAVQALVALRGKNAERVLTAALGDSTAAVREAAAEGLGELGAKAALDTLFKAFDRGISSASKSIGQVANDKSMPRILGYLGRVPLTSLTPLFDALLVRRDVGEAAKLQLVVQLQELGTAEARGYLEGLNTRLPPNAPARLRRAIEDAIVRIAP